MVREEHAERRVGVGHRVLEGRPAEVHLHGRRRERESQDHRPSDARGAEDVRRRRPAEFYGVHSIAIDSKGNLYTTETYEGKRLQRFLYKGLAPVTKMNQGVI